MKQILITAAVFIFLVAWTSQARAVEPYFQIGVGAYSRDIVEKSSSLSSFKVDGTADSTRLIAKAGVDIGVVNLYLQGGGANLSIDEFDNYDASMNGAYGGGLRINLYQEPYRDGLKIFVEGNYLRYATNDSVQTSVNCTTQTGCPANTDTYLPRIVKDTIQWNEYTVLMGASGRYFEMGPYGGVRLSKVDGKDRVRGAPDSNFTTQFSATADLKEQDNFGVFFGTDVFLDRAGKTALNFEASLFDVYSFQAGIRTTF